ncbi:hemagglutinin repeat-containing protein, partial [Polycladidibacter hongkongensis]|uniref:hemagglutinin repeat-containing protein n=1 Tax=Polycladidibacter hongkongensis TaxID=1647556 RepID=UPI000AFAA345
KTGDDARIAGAKLTANEISATIDGALEVKSLQDTASNSSSSTSGSVGLGIGVDSLSLSVSGNIGEGGGSSAWVHEQTAITANEKLEIVTAKNTHIEGAVINSQSDDLTLETQTLTHKDIKDHQKQTDWNIGGSVSIGIASENTSPVQAAMQTAQQALPAPLAGEPSTPVQQAQDPAVEQEPAQEPTAPTLSGSVSGDYGHKDKRQTNQATVGQGTILIRDPDKQRKLEQTGATKALASLNRDPKKSQEITKDVDETINFYISDTSVQEAIAAGKKAGEIAELIIDKLLEEDKFAPADKQAVKVIKKHLDDPEVVAQLQSCQAVGKSASFSIWNLLVAPAYADAAVCTVAVAGGYTSISLEGAGALLSSTFTAVGAIAAAALAASTTSTGGTPLEEHIKLDDGRLITLIHNPDEMMGNIIITYPTGEEVAIRVLVTEQPGTFVIDEGFVPEDVDLRDLLEGMNAHLGSGLNILYNKPANTGQNNGNGGSGATNRTVDPGTVYQVRFDPAHPGRPDPAFSVDTSTFTSGATTANGGIRNSRQFWNSWSNKSNNGLSQANQTAVANGRAPVVDDDWLRVFPEHSDFRGQQIIHHHMDYGQYAIPVPRGAHNNSPGFSIWHPPRGSE